jgi:hypothetical protein
MEIGFVVSAAELARHMAWKVTMIVINKGLSGSGLDRSERNNSFASRYRFRVMCNPLCYHLEALGVDRPDTILPVERSLCHHMADSTIVHGRTYVKQS